MSKNTESRTTKLIRKVFNFRSWMDWQRVKSSAQYLKKAANSFFVIQPPEPRESFSEAVVRLKLSESDITERMLALWQLSMLMLAVAFPLFIYFILQFFYGSWRSILVTGVVIGIALVFSFRYHFWYFQIKQRRLGHSLKEWFSQGVLGKKA